MKIQQALDIIENNEKQGFMVKFDVILSDTYYSDNFPDKSAGEKLIKTQEEAWSLAEKFAHATSNHYVNIHVINSYYKPVIGYKNKLLKKHKII